MLKKNHNVKAVLKSKPNIFWYGHKVIFIPKCSNFSGTIIIIIIQIPKKSNRVSLFPWKQMNLQKWYQNWSFKHFFSLDSPGKVLIKDQLFISPHVIYLTKIENCFSIPNHFNSHDCKFYVFTCKNVSINVSECFILFSEEKYIEKFAPTTLAFSQFLSYLDL